MNRIKGKTALITGATSGFGQAAAMALADMGVNLILVGRRQQRLMSILHELNVAEITIETLSLDIRDRQAVESNLQAILDSHQIDILINNAGLASGLGTLDQGDIDDWEKMIDTNIKGLLYVSRMVLPQMRQRNTGHIINIGSMAGNTTYPDGNVYCATKAAVHTLGQAMNIDLTGTNIRVCTLAPGAANTEFSEVRFHGDRTKANAVYDGFQPLTAEDVAEMMVYILNAPEHVNIQKVDMMPTAQRSPYHLHRGID